jgi:drug/metabolite transporter (DMT)-like permease
MKKQTLAYVYVLLAAVFWGSTAAVGKLVLRDLNNFQVLLFISFIAMMTLFFISLSQGKLGIIKKYKISDYKKFAFMGLIGIFLYNIFFYGSLMLASAQKAFIVNYLWPIFVVVFSIILLKETFTFRKLFAIIFGFIGVYFVATGGDFLNFNIPNLLGLAFAFIGAILYGLFSVFGKKQDYDRITSMMFYYAFAFVFILITVLLFSNIPMINAYQLIGLLWLGVFSASFSFVFWFLALKYGDTAKMSNIIFLTPFISLIYIYFLLGEKILLSSVIGLIIIVIGIIIQKQNNKN